SLKFAAHHLPTMGSKSCLPSAKFTVFKLTDVISARGRQEGERAGVNECARMRAIQIHEVRRFFQAPATLPAKELRRSTEACGGLDIRCCVFEPEQTALRPRPQLSNENTYARTNTPTAYVSGRSFRCRKARELDWAVMGPRWN